MFQQAVTKLTLSPAYLKEKKPDIEELYDSYAPALYGCILKWVNEEKLAAQILEKSFVQIWRNCQTVECLPTRIFPWMYAICKQVALSGFTK